MATPFIDLYKYVTENGTVIPDTSELKDMVETRFKEIFGDEISTDPNTPTGLFIESITMLCKNVLGVNAQNANWSGTTQTIGPYLDAIGSLFGVSRLLNETDTEYRQRLEISRSRGSGFAESIRQAVSNVNGVTDCTVLNNGHAYPAVMPQGVEYGIAVEPHSVFICVNGGIDNDIAEAIISAKSAGCGYTTTADYGTVTSMTVTDGNTGSENDVKFYRPIEIEATFDVTVDPFHYEGEDIEADINSLVEFYLSHHTMGSVLKPIDIERHLTEANLGFMVKSVVIRYLGQEVDKIVVKPHQIVTASSITVIK